MKCTRLLKGCTAIVAFVLRPRHVLRRSRKPSKSAEGAANEFSDFVSPEVVGTAERTESKQSNASQVESPAHDEAQANDTQDSEAIEKTANIVDFDWDSRDVFVFDTYEGTDMVPVAKLSIIEGHAAIVPDASLALGLRYVLFDHIEAKKVEAKYQEEFAVLGSSAEALQQKIVAHQQCLEDDKTDQNRGDDDRKEQVVQLSQAKEAIIERQAELKAHLRQTYEDMRVDQIKVFDILQGILLCQPEDHQRDPWKSSSIGPDNDAVESGKIGGSRSEAGQAEVPEEPRQSVLRDLEALWRDLEDAEEQLEYRDEYFARERAQRKRLEDAGQRSATSSQVDLLEVQTTQRMTQRVANAEEAYAVAKAAAIAAGIQPPGSHVESGFVDDSSEVREHELAMETDVVTPAMMKRVEAWLEGLPVAGVPSADIEDVVKTEEPARDLDEWNAEEVELWESWSMVADGADRRRIDKWKAISSAAN